MAMTKFILPPDNSAYSVTDGKEVVATQLDGGAARYRKDILNATSTVNASWVLTDSGYKYLRSFYRGVTVKGALPFLIDLILDEPVLTEHKVYFIPGSMQLTGQKGLAYWVSAQLEVYPNEDEDNGDFAWIYNEFGENWRVSFDKLDLIVNQLWPEVL